MFYIFAVLMISGQVAATQIVDKTFPTAEACQAWLDEQLPTANEHIKAQFGVEAEVIAKCTEKKDD